GPGLLRPPGGAERAEIGAQRRGVPVEGVDRLQRAQRRVELRRVAIKRVERRLDALLLVALLGHRQILDARQRLPRRSLRSGPGFVLHYLIMRLQRPPHASGLAWPRE